MGAFDGWFRIPSPGYTVFWTMPETCVDPNFLISRLIGSSLEKVESLVVHSTRWNVDGFLDALSTLDPSCALRLLSMGPHLHFVDSYSSRLELYGRPLAHHGMDVRYVTDTCKARGPGTVSEVFREIREEFKLENFLGVENSLTDLATDMGEYQHTKLFSDIVCEMRARGGTMIGVADWYSHGETYKANIIHLADASLLWGITSGGNKAKYLLPIKRCDASSASSYNALPYDLDAGGIAVRSDRDVQSASEGAPDVLYR